jgi:hypothetical protein
VTLPELSQQAEPVEIGHLHIERNRVGAINQDALERHPPVDGVADDFDVRKLLEHRPEDFSVQSGVVDDEHSQWRKVHGVHRSGHWSRSR